MTSTARLDHVAVILNRPRYPENIGAAARAIRNMGVGQLVVVAPENRDQKRIFTQATHAAADVVEEIRYFETLPDALATYHWVVGTTARLGGQRQEVFSASRMAQTLIPITQQNRVALLFGPEDKGLTNKEIRSCHQLVNIPTAEFSSLNLAQAVMVICYELFKTKLPTTKTVTPRLASRLELDGMYEQVKDILVRINYIQPENPDYWMNKLRRFFSRLQLRAGDVSILRGICRQINWYCGQCYRDGAEGKTPPIE